MIKEDIKKSVLSFISWLDEFGEFSYDRMDFWSSKPGIFTKKVFYKNKLLGAPLAGFALIQETFFPSLLKLYAEPRREAIGDGHYAKAFLNLFQLTGEEKYLLKAEEFLIALKESSCQGYSGFCWGYTFGWETPLGYWEPKTPLITITPYGFWAFKKHYELTGSDESRDICISVAEFATKDLNKTEMPNGTTSTSYSPMDQGVIINANTYRAALLLDAYELSSSEKYKKEALESIEFVLAYQKESGAWYYEAKPEKDTFIDNFHTCFVLRNLFMCYLHLKEESLLIAIEKGYQYYRDHLFRADGTPLHFSDAKYIKFRKYEMYDYAEGIKLGALMKNYICDSFDFSAKLADELINRFQLNEGYFITRVTSFNQKQKIPYHRWPQAQLFCSLTELLLSMKESSGNK